MKDFGYLWYFSGIKFARSEVGIQTHQIKYTLEQVSEVGLGVAKYITTLLKKNIKLTTIQIDKLLNKTSKEMNNLPTDVTNYYKIIGNLLYLSLNSLDKAFSV